MGYKTLFWKFVKSHIILIRSNLRKTSGSWFICFLNALFRFNSEWGHHFLAPFPAKRRVNTRL